MNGTIRSIEEINNTTIPENLETITQQWLSSPNALELDRTNKEVIELLWERYRSSKTC